MYDFLRGVVAARGEGVVVLDLGGVGYRLLVSASTLQRTPPSGEALLYTHLLVREERLELIGFATRTERHLFQQLLLVSGVGPAIALALLSASEPEVLAAHIASGDLNFLTRVKGVGKRTGERILVDLRDRFRKKGLEAAPAVAAGGPREDAILALCSLGLARAEAEQRLAAVSQPGLSLEELVKEALRRRPPT